MPVEILPRGWVSRSCPQVVADDESSVIRQARYGEIYAISHIRKQHALADEGSYFSANNGQTGILTSLLGLVFSQTTASPVFIITNSDGIANRRIHLDWMHLLCTASGAYPAGPGSSSVSFAWTVDAVDRYSSGGTDLTRNIVNPNMDVVGRASVASIRFGALTLTGATGNARILVGQRRLRGPASTTTVCAAQDHTLFTFGNLEPLHGPKKDLSVDEPSGQTWAFTLPGIIIGPNQCAILHLWSQATLTTGITFLPELAWWER
jgi:hypothetical protein